MILKVFAVYDSKVQAYMAPFFMRTRGEAARSWEGVVNKPDTAFCAHPADFTLFEVGEYDDSNGRLTSLNVFVPVGTALEFKKAPEAPIPMFSGGSQVAPPVSTASSV